MPLEEIENNVGYISSSYEWMAKRWELIHDLLGGTFSMRERGTTWLPREPREEIIAYNNRLQRSILYGAFEDTLEKLVSKPFSKPMTLKDGLPNRLKEMAINIDRQGRDITTFGRSVFWDALAHGLSHVYVNAPEQGKTPDRLTSKLLNINPYFIHISPTQIIGWRSRPGIGQEPVLTQLRIKDTRMEPKGTYGEKEVEYIRVVDEQMISIWRKEKDQENYTLDNASANRFPGGGIPLVTFYVNQTDFMMGKPPLEKLAWMNLEHYQVSSDIRNCLRFASVGMWTATGITEDEKEAGFTIGPAHLLGSSSAEAKFGIIEPSGSAIEIGNRHLENLEARMEVLGLQPFMRKTGNITATGRAMDESRTQSNIHSWIRNLENVFDKCFHYASLWVNEPIQEGFGTDIFSEFGISMRAEKDLEILLKMAMDDRIPNDVFLFEVQKRGTLSDHWDIEEINIRAGQGSAPQKTEEELYDIEEEISV